MTYVLSLLVVILLVVVLRLLYAIRRLKGKHVQQLAYFQQALALLKQQQINLQQRSQVNAVYSVDFKPISDEIVTLQKMLFEQIAREG
ncbi:MAG: hypothetical protein ACOVP9_09625 [Flavobacterium stagni]